KALGSLNKSRDFFFWGGGGGGRGEDTWLIRKAKILNDVVEEIVMRLPVRSLSRTSLCLEQSALEKTSASFENSLIFEIKEIKGVIKISECCDGLL
ncbi:hypothetical protein HID58_019244, partial [Brassica napus]